MWRHQGGVVVLLIGAGSWRVGEKWGGISDFLSDFGSFCVWTLLAAVLMGFLAFWPNRVGTDESSMPMRVTRFPFRRFGGTGSGTIGPHYSHERKQDSSRF